MINKHKKFLTAAVFCAIASTGFVLTRYARPRKSFNESIKTPCPAAM